MHSNRIQIFSELVSLEAWHLPFTTRRMSVGLHADVTFATARFGAEADCPVRFKMRLKKAILTVEVPETEALLIDRGTVLRLNNAIAGVRKIRSSQKSKAAIGAGFSAKGGMSGASLSASASASASKSGEHVDETTLTSKFDAILVQHSVDFRGNNRWSFTPGAIDTLAGKPWAAADKPLMKLRDAEPAGKRKLEASVRLELSCLREDLEIFDIEPKEKNLIPLSSLKSSRRLIAAEAFIKTRLQQEGLPSPSMSEDYAIITLARTNSIEGNG